MKEKIKDIVEQYRVLHASEYKQMCDYIEDQRKKLADQEHGGGSGDMHALMEIPVTLNQMLIEELDVDERQEFARLENRKWFAKTFKEFSLPDNV